MRVFAIILLLFLTFQTVMAETPTQPTQSTVGHVSVESCSRRYNTTSEKLFYLTLSALSKYNYQISETQSKSGYILFTANNTSFLASVSKIDANNSILKIMPEKNNFYFPSIILTNIFNYITLNLRLPVQAY